MIRIPHEVQLLKEEGNKKIGAPIQLNSEVKKSKENGTFVNVFLNQVQKKQVLNRIIDLYIEAVPASQITEIILIEYPSIKASKDPNQYISDHLLREASALMIESHSNQFEMIAVNHVFIYETLFRFFRDNDLVSGQMTALKQKEKLLGLHSDDSLVNIDIQTEIDETTVGVGYDTSRLTEEEVIRFQHYLNIIT